MPSIERLLRNSIAKENYIKNNTVTEEVSVDDFTRTHNITEPITDYICPVVEQFYASDDNRVVNVEEGEYTPYVQSLLMYRSLDNEDLATNFSQRYFASKGFGIAKIDETFE